MTRLSGNSGNECAGASMRSLLGWAPFRATTTTLAVTLVVVMVCQVAHGSTITVSVVGDSITSHAAASNNSMTYPAQLQRILGRGYVVINAGESGHTMLKNGLCGNGPGGSWRRPCLSVSTVPACFGNCTYWDSPQMANTTASNPDIVTIMLGTNDAKSCSWNGPINGQPLGTGAQFAADYKDMISLFKALPSKPKVFVVLPPPAISQCTATGPAGNASICLAYNMSFHAINEIFPVLQRQIAKEAGADGVIDVWTALNGTNISTSATADGIHPRDEALGVIANTIAKAIRTV